MALARRRSDRFSASIWPGFVDAMTALLLVLMFVLSIFMIVQFTLRETITGQESELGQLHTEIAKLADALGMEREKSTDLEQQVGTLDTTLAAALDDAAASERMISTLSAEIDAQKTELAGAGTRIADFEAQVAALLLERDRAQKGVAELEAQREQLTDARASLETALASVHEEMDLQTEQARLDAAKREALEALIADLKAKATAADATLAEKDAHAANLEAQLSQEEADRIATAAAAEALRKRLQGSEDELNAMTLALEEKRREAEETLTLLAAAQSAEGSRNEELSAAREARRVAELAAAEQMTVAEKRAALLNVAQRELEQKNSEAAENARSMALLNANVASLRSHLASLEDLLDASDAREQQTGAEREALGARLNSALAQVAIEQKARARAEAARAEAEAERARLKEAERIRLEEEKARLEAEARDLKTYRSEFFGRLRKILGGREGVRIEGDRFVFSSEVLFEPASAEISAEGQAQIAGVGNILSEVASEIPPEIDWIIRVDGHTDDTALSGNGRYRDNWELSQARALAVVRYMTDDLGFPADRLAANGFGEFQPVSREDTDEARARNRRIELKLTER